MVTTTVNDVLSKLQFRRSAASALEAALSSLPSRATPVVRRFDQTDRSATVEIVSANTTGEVRPGDIVAAGLSLRFDSEPQEGLAISALYSRLQCLNDLRPVECTAPARILRTRNDAHLRDVAHLSRGIWNELPRKLEDLRTLPKRLADVPALLDDSVRRAGLSRARVLPQLFRAWDEEEQASNEWSFLNALTRATTHFDLADLERSALERTAGAYAFRRSHSCSQCMPELSWWNSNALHAVRDFVIAGLQPTNR